MKSFIKNLPKAELHVHLEGTIGPDLLLALAARNNIALPYANAQEARAAYRCSSLENFIDAYVHNARVLRTQQDFYDVAWSYVQAVQQQGVCHLEISFDIQTHMTRGIHADVVINGIHAALNQAEKQYGMTSAMIMCFIRDRSEQEALQALDVILPHRDKIIAVGLASVEHGNPPSKFQHVFARARELGFRLTAHAGETDITSIKDTIMLLHVERIDHGVHAAESVELMDLIKQKNIPLTVCPLSNIVLGSYRTIQEHPIKTLYDAGITVTINSDDPAFFGGDLVDNYRAAATMLSHKALIVCARNSLEAAFLSDEQKQRHLQQFDAYIKQHMNDDHQQK